MIATSTKSSEAKQSRCRRRKRVIIERNGHNRALTPCRNALPQPVLSQDMRLRQAAAVQSRSASKANHKDLKAAAVSIPQQAIETYRQETATRHPKRASSQCQTRNSSIAVGASRRKR